jgi:hypothetical protein
VCERYGGASCADPNWAQWPVTQTENYTDNGDMTVTDNGTALVWQQTVSGKYTLAAAIAYCGGLNLGGYQDWRLPSIVELISLVDMNPAGGTINTTYFPSAPFANFWSATPHAPSNAMGWIVNVSAIATALGTDANYVRCVR